MNKTKRTLIVSSVVMALILVVTAVSVTAAWFSNFANSKAGGFTIDSALLQESVNITIDSSASDYGTALWPAVATPGYLEKGALAPYGTDLKEKKDETYAVNGVQKAAKCAVIYFPIRFEGSPDLNDKNEAIDGRRSLYLDVQHAYLGTKPATNGNGNTAQNGAITEDATKDYLSWFNVEMKLVKVTKTVNGETVTTTVEDLPSTQTPQGEAGDVYYNQPNTANDKYPGYKLYMLLKPGVEYYVQATIYFNKLDEECDEKLLYLDAFQEAQKAISFKFELHSTLPENTSIRNNHMTP